LVTGVLANQLEIDEILAGVAQNWTLDRMPALDKAILRVGIYEIAYSDTPSEVAISEAVDLAQELSTEDSPAFINGVLATVPDRTRAVLFMNIWMPAIIRFR
jgi:N utilization substance protein B